jgi:putative methyltransferase (TIGR04325 family)
MNTKKFLRSLVPPVLLEVLQRSGRAPSNPMFELPKVVLRGRFQHWSEALAAATSYESPEILARVQKATRAVLAGQAAFERDGVAFPTAEMHWFLCFCLADMKSQLGEDPRVLDFGGSLGSTFFQNRAYLRQISGLRWGIVEQEHFVSAGSEFAESGLEFFSSVSKCASQLSPSVALLSGALQYIPEPENLLAELAQTSVRFLVIDRLMCSEENRDYVALQSVGWRAYKDSYPLWIFSRQRLYDVLSSHWRIIIEEWKDVCYEEFDPIAVGTLYLERKVT